MRFFNQQQIVFLDKTTIEKAKRFASDVVGTIDYGDSNQYNKEKIKEDHFVSKLGEEAVKQVFEKFSKEVKGPDYIIYNQKQKSWDADLFIDDIPLAVKAQKKSSALRYGLSWTFQASSFRRDTILNEKDAWVCFVECNDLAAYTCIVYPPLQMKELVLKDPILPHLKGKKLVAYEKDLPKRE